MTGRADQWIKRTTIGCVALLALIAEERADAGPPAYGLHALRTDLDRFTFLLGGTEGQHLFGQY